MDGVCSPKGDAATHCYKHSQTLSSSLSLILIHPTYPLWTPARPPPLLTPPATRHNLTHAWKGCLSVYGKGQEKRGSSCGLCHGVCHLLSRSILGIVCLCVFGVCVWCVCVCVCVCGRVCMCGQRGLAPGGPILRGCCTITCQAEDMSPRG